MEKPGDHRYEDCFRLFLLHKGRNFCLIEREMRALGYADFNRRILYSRKEKGEYKPGWIEKYGWRTACRNAGTLARTDAIASATAGDKPYAVKTKERAGSPRSDANFQAWLKSVSPEMTWNWRYQKYIYSRLQKITSGESKRLMIFLPPRHGKSELVTVRYAGWRLWNDPKMRVIVTSYNQRLADTFSRSIRRLLSNEEDKQAEAAGTFPSPKGTKSIAQGKADGRYPGLTTFTGLLPEGEQPPTNGVAPLQGAEEISSVPGVTLDPLAHPGLLNRSPSATETESQTPQRMFPRTRTINTVSQWETAAGGGVKAVGVGAGVTGFGAQLIIIDDPVKSRADAESETLREKVWDWYRNDLYTRLEPNGSIVLIQTRWHEDDLAGRLLNDMADGGDQWEVVNLPALAEPGAVATGLPSAERDKDNSPG